MTVNVFKKIILLHLFLFFSFIPITIIQEIFFPYEWVEPNIPTIDFIIFLLIFFLAPFTYYYLYKLKPIGKKLFVFWIIIIISIPFWADPNIYVYNAEDTSTPYFILYDSLMNILSGVILTFLFFSDVKEKFK